MFEFKKGTVLGIITHEDEEKEDILVVKNRHETVYILHSEASLSPRNPLSYIGVRLQYEHTVQLDGRQYASGKVIHQRFMDYFQTQFKNYPQQRYDATVVEVFGEHAILTLEGFPVMLDRRQLTREAVLMHELVSVGEVLRVKLYVVTPRFIHVKCVDERLAISHLTADDLAVGDLVYGVVNSAKTMTVMVDNEREKRIHAFAQVAYGIDGLAPMRDFRPVRHGNEVVFKINQLAEGGHLRGKILRVLNSRYEFVKHVEGMTEIPLHVGATVTGKVRIVRHDPLLNEDTLILFVNNHPIIVPFSQLSGYDSKRTLISWVGYTITVMITDDSTRLIASKMAYDRLKRQAYINTWRQTPDEVRIAYLRQELEDMYVLVIGDEEIYLLKSDCYRLTGALPDIRPNDKVHVSFASADEHDLYVNLTPPDFEQILATFDLTLTQFSHPDFHSQLYQATIAKLLPKGAYVTIQGVMAFLPNASYALDKTRVIDRHQVGDELTVELVKIADQKLYVQQVPRIFPSLGLTFEELSEGMLVHGVVRSSFEQVSPETGETQTCLFTSFGPLLEGLSPQSKYFEAKIGDSVVFRINQIRDDQQIRGRVIRLLNKNSSY